MFAKSIIHSATSTIYSKWSSSSSSHTPIKSITKVLCSHLIHNHSSSSSSSNSSRSYHTSQICYRKFHEKEKHKSKLIPITKRDIIDRVEDQRPEDMVKDLDLTLTPKQIENVAILNKKIHGGINTKRSIYRDVPEPDELSSMGNFSPNLAPNGQQLIDYALSFVPVRAGPRRSRHKQRMVLRHAIRIENDARRIKQTKYAVKRKAKKAMKNIELTKLYRLQAIEINNSKNN